MNNIDTLPNPYIDGVTYISVKSDWSNLIEKIEDVILNYKNYSYAYENFRQEFSKNYAENISHWYDVFKKFRYN